MVGKGAGSTAGVYLVRPPRPIVAPPGDRVVFECETNVAAERVVWLRDGVEFSSSSSTTSSSTTSAASSAGPRRRNGRQVEPSAFGG